MRWLAHLGFHVRSLFAKQKLDEQLSEEIRTHVEMATDANVAAGMSPEEARYAALREFGNVAGVQERTRDERDWVWLADLWTDIKYGGRQLINAPGFSMVAILTLAIGIGATTAIFSVVNSVVLRPLGFPEPEQLVAVQEWYRPRNIGTYASPAAFAEWKTRATVFSHLAAVTPFNGNMTGEGDPLRLFAYQATRDYFSALRVQPVKGRGFLDEEYQNGKNRVFLLNYKTWVNYFGAREDIVGSVVKINDWPATIIGVMPEGFQSEPGGPMAYTPLVESPELAGDFKQRMLISAVGRLKPGISVEQATREMDAIALSIEQAQPLTHEQMGIKVTPLLEAKVGKVRPLLWVLFGAVGCLLLIACVNVANLLLVRGESRRREIAVRAALGAGRGRIVRQLLVESMLLAGVGGVLGALLAGFSLQFLLSFAPVDLPRIDEVNVDARVLGFAILVTTLVGIGFGFVPAWRATQGDLVATLKDGGRSSDGSHRLRLRSLLIVAQIALALNLLLGAGLLVRSFDRLQHKDLGYDPHVAYVSRIFLLPNKYADNQQRVAFVDRVLEQYGNKPDLLFSAFTSAFPHHQTPVAPIVIEGGEQSDLRVMPRVNVASITPDYFQVMSNPLIAGRWFTDRDRDNSMRVAIIGKRLADEFFPAQNPLGKRLSLPTNQREWCEIVGVVNDVVLHAPTQLPLPQVYFPFSQQPAVQFMSVVRVRPGAANPVASVTTSIHAVDPEMPVPPKLTLIAEYVANAIAVQRFATFVFTFFSAVAVLLAAIGIYGVTAYAVSQRTREIGIRMALGAQQHDVLRLVLGSGGRIVTCGLLVGVGIGLGVTRALQSWLFEVAPADPLTFTGVSLLLFVITLLATWLPARRATKVNPVIALRAE